MSGLRIHADKGNAAVAPAQKPDTWPARLAKLVPAEALGLYSVGIPLIPEGQKIGHWILAIVTLVFCAAIRIKETNDPVKGPQWSAVAIALVSFVIWLLTQQPPAELFDLGSYKWVATLVAVLWSAVISYFYKGD